MSEILKVIDVDVHNELKKPQDLVPYLPEPWKTRVAASGIGMMGSGYWSPVGGMRKDTKPPGGGWKDRTRIICSNNYWKSTIWNMSF